MFSADNHCPRWYILTYLGARRDALKRLSLIDLPSFAPAFYASEPSYASRQDYRELASYAFVCGTQDQIYTHKRQLLRSFNFLPMAHSGGRCHPYVDESVIQQLRQVEAANDGKIPYMPYPTDVAVGDTVKILVGDFVGYQAKAISQKGSKFRQIVLDIAGRIAIPLCRLKAGEYEIVKYSEQHTPSAGNIIRKEDETFLHHALGRHYGVLSTDGDTDSDDQTLTNALIARYRNAVPSTHDQRVRISALLAMAYTILGDTDEQQHYVEHTIHLVGSNSSPARQARTYSTLYGCTFNEEYFRRHLSALRLVKDGKSSKSIAEATKMMSTYHQWHDAIHSRRARHVFRCPDDDIHWFAIEILSSAEEVAQSMSLSGIATYDLPQVPASGKAVLLVRATFEQLKRIKKSCPRFAFLPDVRDGEEQPLRFDDTTLDDYRYLQSVMPSAITTLELTPEYDAILSKAKRTAIPIGDRTISGIISTSTVKRKKHQRFILHLRHLCAIAIPYPLPAVD